MKYIVSILFLLLMQVQAYDYFDMKKVAMKAYKSGNKTKAYEITKKFITTHPNEIKAKNLLAVLYYWNKDYVTSKAILEDLLSKNSYKESTNLLKKINKKLAKSNVKKVLSPTSKKSIEKKELSKSSKNYKDIKNNTKYEDLKYLTQYVQDNPKDLQSRIILSKYYYKIQDYKKSYSLAKEALLIDPKQKDMKKIISHIKNNGFIKEDVTSNNDYDQNRLKTIMNQYFREKNYNAYFNIYQALKDKGIKFSQREYTDALYTSIMVGNYKEAQNIISSGKLPKNKHTLKLQMLLTDKLSNKVASK